LRENQTGLLIVIDLSKKRFDTDHAARNILCTRYRAMGLTIPRLVVSGKNRAVMRKIAA
jgi:hypothetical protein